MIQIHSILQNLISQTLPALITSQTKEIERMTQIALSKASHAELLRMLIVDYIFDIITTVLPINQENENYRGKLSKTLETQLMTTRHFNHEIHIAAKSIHLTPIRIFAFCTWRCSLQVGESRTSVVALLTIKQPFQNTLCT